MGDSTLNPSALQGRIEAHRRFSERAVDFFAWVVDHVPWRGGERVLDVGCGTGVYVPYYRARGAGRVVGVDLSPEMLAQARARFPDTAFCQGRAEALPFPAMTFDVVFANHVLFFVEDIPQALREARRVLRPGGWFVAATNAAKALDRLHAFHAAALQAIGRRPQPLRHRRFALENGRPLVAAVFGQAEIDVLDNAFRFPTVEDALAYYLSGEVYRVEGPPLTPAEQAQVVAQVREALARVLAAEGVCRIPKPAGVILARREE